VVFGGRVLSAYIPQAGLKLTILLPQEYWQTPFDCGNYTCSETETLVLLDTRLATCLNALVLKRQIKGLERPTAIPDELAGNRHGNIIITLPKESQLSEMQTADTALCTPDSV
jgi:hypothetical protein